MLKHKYSALNKPKRPILRYIIMLLWCVLGTNLCFLNIDEMIIDADVSLIILIVVLYWVTWLYS